MNTVAVGGPYLARLVDLDGDQKNWRVDTPQFNGEESEEPAAAKPGAKPAAKQTAKKAAEVAGEHSSKRRRKLSSSGRRACMPVVEYGLPTCIPGCIPACIP